MNNQYAKRKELGIRGMSSKRPTVITGDNYNIVESKEFALDILHQVKKLMKVEKVTHGITEELMNFLTMQSPRSFIGEKYKNVISMLAHRFAQSVYNKKIEQSMDTTSEYMNWQHSNINNMTENENPYKFTAHVNREANNIDINKYSDGKPRVEQTDNELLAEIVKFLQPTNITNLFTKISSLNTTFENITLPRTKLLLDSRYRNPMRQGTISWNIHSSVQEGSIGNVRVQDTLQQAIQFKICPFWLPINVEDTYYGIITVSVKEFSMQSVHYVQYLGKEEDRLYFNDYHFTCKISQIENGRAYLEPCGGFAFRKPIAQINSLSISFASPFQDIEIQKDREIFMVTPGNPTTLISTNPHGISTADLVYVINYNSSNTSLNDDVNSFPGYLVTRTDAYTITIPIDTTGFPSDPVTIIFGSKRIFFEMEFISLEQ